MKLDRERLDVYQVGLESAVRACEPTMHQLMPMRRMRPADRVRESEAVYGYEYGYGKPGVA